MSLTTLSSDAERGTRCGASRDKETRDGEWKEYVRLSPESFWPHARLPIAGEEERIPKNPKALNKIFINL